MYPFITKLRRYLSYDKVRKLVSHGLCLCHETTDDNHNLIQFTENPSASWHKPMNLYTAFTPPTDRPSGPDDWNAALDTFASERKFIFFPAQKRAAAQLLAMGSGVLAAEGGSGKTLIAATAVALRTSNADVVVIVAPEGVHQQWQSEIRRFLGRRATPTDHPGALTSGINLISPAAFRGLRKFSVPVAMVVADEAHFLANNSEQAEGFLACTAGVPVRIALTATPVPNRLSEIFNLLGWVSSPYWPTQLAPTFPFARHEQARFEEEYTLSSTGTIASPERVRELLNPFFVTLTKTECRPDMPPLHLSFQPCPMPRSTSDAWHKCFKEGTPSSIEMDFLTANPRCSGKSVIAARKLQRLLQAGVQVMVVSVRKHPLQQLFTLLSEAGIPVARIYSDVPDTTYADAAASFNSGASRVCLMGLRCAQSYSFANCKHVILIGSDFTYGMFHQALWRCHRLTSTEAVTVHVLYYAGTNEPLVLERVAGKSNQASLVMGDRDYDIQRPPSVSFHRTVEDSWVENEWADIKKSLPKVLDTARANGV